MSAIAIELPGPPAELVVWIPVNAYKGRTAYACVDKADELWALQYKWGLAKDGYAYRQLSWTETDRRPSGAIAMHRELLGLQRGDKRVSDHINRCKWDNRRENLRVLDTQAHNLQNLSKRVERTRNLTSGHRGVSRWTDGSAVLWRARVTVNGKERSRYFKTEDEAIEGVKTLRAELMPFAAS